jgi:bacteriocin-like protein
LVWCVSDPGSFTELSFDELETISGGWHPFDPAKSDGCTDVPDGIPFLGINWRDACVEHDRAYVHGGSEADRLAADKKLNADMVADGAPHWVGRLYQWGTDHFAKSHWDKAQ